MSSLMVVDVFETYYDGRKSPFPADVMETSSHAVREDRKPNGKPAKPVPQTLKAA